MRETVVSRNTITNNRFILAKSRNPYLHWQSFAIPNTKRRNEKFFVKWGSKANARIFESDQLMLTKSAQSKFVRKFLLFVTFLLVQGPFYFRIYPVVGLNEF